MALREKMRFEGNLAQYCSALAACLSASLYCFRLPGQRGRAPESGRNRPMNTWLRKVLWAVALAGRACA